jgi:hypothetical protein
MVVPSAGAVVLLFSQAGDLPMLRARRPLIRPSGTFSPGGEGEGARLGETSSAEDSPFISKG